jgi:hypothetical protein
VASLTSRRREDDEESAEETETLEELTPNEDASAVPNADVTEAATADLALSSDITRDVEK